MTTYYVDYVNGADANNGLGPDASHASNKPWKTISKLLGAAGMASGDTAYLSPAGPFREVVTAAMTAATVETKILGDPQNAQGFKTSGGVKVTPGDVIWTAFTTDDKTVPSASSLFTPAGRHFLTFQNITMIGSNATTINAATFTHDMTFKDCLIYTGRANALAVVSITGSAGDASNWLFDRCILKARAANAVGGVLTVTLPRHTADYDCAIVFRNGVILGGGSPGAVRIISSGAGAGFGGGVLIRNSSILLALQGVTTGDANLSTSIPCQVNNCIVDCSTALNANTSGQITESYNWLNPTSPRTNVTAGTGSTSDGSYALLLELGQDMYANRFPRRFLEPTKSSPLLAFGNDGNQTAYDLRNKPRPAGGNGSALPGAGAMDRGNTFITDTSPIGGGATAIKITGPGYAEFLIPTKASSMTISCVVKWDATYAGTKPQLQIDANGRVGTAAETKTAVGSSGSNETLTLSAVTPSTANDLLTVRVISNDTNGGGLLQVDNFAIA